MIVVIETLLSIATVMSCIIFKGKENCFHEYHTPYIKQPFRQAAWLKVYTPSTGLKKNNFLIIYEVPEGNIYLY